MKPLIGLTLGDPAGIGPEIILKALTSPRLKPYCSFVVYGDTRLLENVNQNIFHRRSLPSAQYENVSQLSVPPFRWGKSTAAYGYASGRYIEEAVRDAKLKRIKAVVTAPIHKESFLQGGWGKRFRGHTEMIANLTNTRKFALMLVHGPLRAVHVTSHIPLRKVPSLISIARVFDTILLTDKGLRDIGIRQPRIAVCGLNPHAGENGILGSEEKKIISPAIKLASKKLKGVVNGPLPSDTVWPLVRDQVFDAGVAMYHDQGQIPIKLSSFTRTSSRALVGGVNITLGIPIVRTSVAHGTAFELAGKGVASAESLIQAVEMALLMIKRKRT